MHAGMKVITNNVSLYRHLCVCCQCMSYQHDCHRHTLALSVLFDSVFYILALIDVSCLTLMFCACACKCGFVLKTAIGLLGIQKHHYGIKSLVLV